MVQFYHERHGPRDATIHSGRIALKGRTIYVLRPYLEKTASLPRFLELDRLVRLLHFAHGRTSLAPAADAAKCGSAAPNGRFPREACWCVRVVGCEPHEADSDSAEFLSDGPDFGRLMSSTQR